jgi:acetyltransferase-like isoleucine patch superfamily enzyme
MSTPLTTRVREALRIVVQTLRRQYFIRVWRMQLGEGTTISFGARLDKTNPRGVHIGKYSVVTFGAAVLTHDWVNHCDRDVRIGDDCFIGAHSIILPGVTIGDHCIVAAASVVARDVPAGSLVAGNPARIVETGIRTTHYGIRLGERKKAPAFPPNGASRQTAHIK